MQSQTVSQGAPILRCKVTKIRKHVVLNSNPGIEKGQIAGVHVKQLTLWPDDRGHFVEIFRNNEPVCEGFETLQSSVTMTRGGVIKAFHYHHFQDDIFCPIVGTIRIALIDFREDSPSYGYANSIFCGEQYMRAVRIPKGVAHGYEVLGSKDMTMVYYTNQHYNPKDELRQRFDDPEIGWEWWGVDNR